MNDDILEDSSVLDLNHSVMIVDEITDATTSVEYEEKIDKRDEGIYCITEPVTNTEDVNTAPVLPARV